MEISTIEIEIILAYLGQGQQGISKLAQLSTVNANRIIEYCITRASWISSTLKNKKCLLCRLLSVSSSKNEIKFLLNSMVNYLFNDFPI